MTIQDNDPATQLKPRVLNADNRKPWVGAYFDYSRSFRDSPCLASGELTEAVLWQVQPLASEGTFVTIRVSLTHKAP